MPFGKKCVLIFFFFNYFLVQEQREIYTWMVIQRMVMKDILYSVEERAISGDDS